MNTTKSDDTKVFFFTRRLSPYCFGAGGPREETSTRRHIEEETPPHPPQKGLLAFKDRETIKTREQERRWFFEGAEFSTVHTLVEIFFLSKKTFRPFGDLSDTKKNKKKRKFGCPQKIEFKIFPKVATQHRRRRAAFSLSFTKRMRAHQREAEESVWNRRSVVFLLFLLLVVI